MEIEPVNEFNHEITQEQFEQLKEQIQLLPKEKKQELATLLLGRDSSLNVVIATNIANANINGTMIQVGTGSEKLSEDLKNISPEAMSELLKAIGKLIGEGAISFGDMS
ncbi:MAG: hypothetical protein J7647_28865 [Cyanobacteria bacterium SBLK]|nr:hypothetical protein [Cyanobacteria bacterium SBLK]